MMDSKNPHAKGAGASMVPGQNTEASSPTRPVLQANPAMRLRLSALLWTSPKFGGGASWLISNRS